MWAEWKSPKKLIWEKLSTRFCNFKIMLTCAECEHLKTEFEYIRNCVCPCSACIFEQFGCHIPPEPPFLSWFFTWFFTVVWMLFIGHLVSHLECMCNCIRINNMSKSPIKFKGRTKSLFRHSYQRLFGLRISYSSSKETYRKKILIKINSWHKILILMAL